MGDFAGTPARCRAFRLPPASPARRVSGEGHEVDGCVRFRRREPEARPHVSSAAAVPEVPEYRSTGVPEYRSTGVPELFARELSAGPLAATRLGDGDMNAPAIPDRSVWSRSLGRPTRASAFGFDHVERVPRHDTPFARASYDANVRTAGVDLAADSRKTAVATIRWAARPSVRRAARARRAG